VISRRRWLQSLALGASGMSLGGEAFAQQRTGGIADTSNLFAMDQSAARSVRLPSKPSAAPSMSVDDRDALEHRIRCQCGCTMDVYTCRTTDFSCQVSPAMHRDILALVQGGYGAQEILDAFVNVYGDRVLMSPPKTGFNILGYILPSVALAIGAVVLAVIIRRWKVTAAVSAPATPDRGLNATPDELARLEAAIRDDS
jgi:cytochrome c-type biogenesis protein CcmH